MQRQFGKLLNKGPGNNAKVSVILNDYEDADKVLAKVGDPPAATRLACRPTRRLALCIRAVETPADLPKIIDSSKSWRDAWVSLVNTQLAVVTEYEGLYDPIVGATDGHGREMLPTPELQLRRTFKLRECYAELKSEMLQEISEIEPRVIRPATDARDCIQPIRKSIKKRENKRLDYEKAQDKVNKLHKKSSRTPKEDSQMAKAEQDMANLGEVRQATPAPLPLPRPPSPTLFFC